MSGGPPRKKETRAPGGMPPEDARRQVTLYFMQRAPRPSDEGGCDVIAATCKCPNESASWSSTLARSLRPRSMRILEPQQLIKPTYINNAGVRTASSLLANRRGRSLLELAHVPLHLQACEPFHIARQIRLNLYAALLVGG